MKPCETKRCKNQTDDLKRFCSDCKKEHKRKLNKRWRKNNPNYNRIYLRSWKRKLRILDAKRRQEFFENPIPFLLKKAVAESEYLEQLRQGAQ